jgi:hypothetical protein
MSLSICAVIRPRITPAVAKRHWRISRFLISVLVVRNGRRNWITQSIVPDAG